MSEIAAVTIADYEAIEHGDKDYLAGRISDLLEENKAMYEALTEISKYSTYDKRLCEGVNSGLLLRMATTNHIAQTALDEWGGVSRTEIKR